jgi:uncharacterized membrane protein YhaH (DUF805 family)
MANLHPEWRPISRNVWSWKGRIGRLRYLGELWIPWVVLAVAYEVFKEAGMPMSDLLTLNLALGLLLAFINTNSMIKRSHDIQRSALYLLWLIVPIVNIVVAIYLHFARSKWTQAELEAAAQVAPSRVT